MAERREAPRQARLPADRPKLPPGDYAGLIFEAPDHVRVIERWQVKESAFKHAWQVARGERDRWAAVYDVTIAWGLVEAPQNRALQALLAARNGALIQVPLWCSYLTRPGSQRAEPPARSSTLYKLLRKARAALVPGQLYIPEAVDFRMPIGLYLEVRLDVNHQDADRDPVDPQDPLAYSVVRKVLKAQIVTPHSPLETTLFSVLGSRYSTLATQHSTSEALRCEKSQTSESAPPARYVGVAPAALMCDVSQAVVVRTPDGGKSAGLTASPTWGAGASASASPGALTAAFATAAMDDEERARWFEHWFKSRWWWNETKEAGPCPGCGEMMRVCRGTRGKADHDRPYCPRCRT